MGITNCIFKKYDFVFVYEVKNRELESICLLRYELERRGYSVKFIETWDQELWKSFPIKAEVTVAFALYNEDTFNFINSFVSECKKFVNLQWEQVYTNGGAKAINTWQKITHTIYGISKNAVHISWGDNNYDRLVKNYGIKEDRVVKIGNISMDFMRVGFRQFYFSKDEICFKYNIDRDKKVYLFISTFSYVNLPQNCTDNELNQNQGFNVNEFQNISIDSQHIVLEWIKKIIVEFPDIIFVYRPHPAEKDNSVLLDMQKEYHNFRVIREESIKQWILIADKIYSWWSTSVAEIYAANKGCSILRPIDVPYESELETYNGASFIRTYDEFRERYLQEEGFPIPKDLIDKHYYIDQNEYSYVKIADLLENVKNDGKYGISGIYTRKHIVRIFGVLKSNIVRKIKYIVMKSDFLFGVGKHISSRKIFLQNNRRLFLENYEYTKNMIKNNHMDTKEIDEIMDKIRKFLG